MSALVWLYAVTGSWSGRLEGIEGGSVRAIDEADLVAVVSDVPESSYEQEKLDEHVRDGAWLTPRATVHQAVNASVHQAAEAALPVPFGTIYRGDDRVREMLRARAGELRAKLASVRGRGEWVIGLYRDSAAAAEHLRAVRDAMAHKEPVTAGAGRRYLEERKNDHSRRAEMARLDEDAAAAAQHAMERVSKQSYEEPVVDTTADLVARTTYLVRAVDEHRLHDAMRGFNADWKERGYELRATGPWPPYRSAA